jgi:hypothetical protein
MMKKIFITLLSFHSLAIHAQQVSITNSAEEALATDRLEVLQGKLFKQVNLTTKHVSAFEFFNEEVEIKNSIDSFNYNSLQQKHIESISEEDCKASKKNILKYFYSTHANLWSYRDKTTTLSINPIVYYKQAKELDNSENIFVNTRGAEIKGSIGNKIYFYSQLTDNQERGPNFMSQFVSENRALPGNGYFKNFKTTGYDYLNARGYISANIINNHISASFGNDRHFIGNGYRSLLLSDFGNNNLFLKLNTKFWKLHYQNLFMELMPQHYIANDTLRSRKYTTMHVLTANITKRWQLSAFEGVIFSRKDHFDFQYLNPVIFYRATEQMLGSPDNAMLGFDSKYIFPHGIELYGQVAIDEFSFKHVRARDKWWANKQAFQLGVKYFDVANIKQLDLQLERNYIRPFMYTYKDSLADYTHYNQALAHPNGANLIENIAIVRYQPLKKLVLNLQMIHRQQGMDTLASFSNGGNIRKDYNLRGGQELGFATLGGTLVTTTYMNFLASYQIRPNIYFDAGVTYRNASSNYSAFANKSTMPFLAFRMNANTREYNF